MQITCTSVFLALPRIKSADGDKTLSAILLLMSSFSSFNLLSNIDEKRESNQTVWPDINNASMTLVFGITSLITSQLTFGGAAFLPAAALCVVPFFTLIKYNNLDSRSSLDNHCQVLLRKNNGETIRYEFAPGCDDDCDGTQDCTNPCEREIEVANVSVSILEKCDLKINYDRGFARIKPEMLGVKGLILSEHFD